MTLPKTLQQQINHIMDPPGKNRDVEETLLQVAHDPDCGDVVRLGMYVNLTGRRCWPGVAGGGRQTLWLRRLLSSFWPRDGERLPLGRRKR